MHATIANLTTKCTEAAARLKAKTGDELTFQGDSLRLGIHSLFNI
jgi:hypothetical protein